MSSSCSGTRQDFIDCVLSSPCIQEDKRSFRECLAKENQDRVPDYCRQLQQLLFDCKRGMIDMRNRIRGNKGY
ncbi:hypothetical protein CAOG_009490 [Capsaspora owczarzaki ATCC 30864]|uniref:Cytochrome c oxidase assembly factor 5 n=1 Tax=Capsaspora owczarzaki (strain ATCC 30864) TaxID=595528 RepID=A0A0D2WKJ1_CAPO3|nr:hypothetical protein CAOG_009490 [Capsaspora owczarzaki ATCC 30864]